MFRTELIIAPAQQQLPRTARVLTIGSCFADSIGSRLTDNKVTTLANPFGTVFQPLAVAQLLRAAAGEDVDWQQHVVEARGRWQSLDLHSSIGADSPVELLQTIGEKVYNAGTFLRQADVVVLTLGTAWAYRSLASGELVSNCQKLPAERFEKELLTPDDIINALAETHAYLRRLNPKLRFVLTVSPVRHLKDTLPLNAVSKSVLRVACHYLSELLPDVSYFPAFELLTDDLRDYRFYGADMLHPTEVAEDYVWDKFARTYFDADFGRFRKEWAAVRQALLHRPLHDGAPEHRQFLESTRERLEQLAAQGVPVGYELADVQQRVATLPEPIAAAPTLAEPEDDGQERIDIDDRAERGAMAIPAPPTTEPDSRAPRTGRSRGGRNRNGRNRDEAAAREVLPVEMGAGVIGSVELAAATDAEEVPEPTDAATAQEVAASATFSETDETEYPAKKKKRRSRGGAKRTARKHAALAAGATAPDGVSAQAAEPTDGAPATASPTTASAGVLDSPTENQSDQTGPRKSSVITKSVPVKRGGRNRRGGRGETALTTDAADTTASAARPVPAELLPPTAPVATEPAAAIPDTTTNSTTAPAAETAPTTPAPAPMRGKQRPLYVTPAAVPDAGTGKAAPAPAAVSLAEQVLGLKPKSQQSLSDLYGEQGTAAPAAVPRWQQPVQPAKVRPQALATATPVAEPVIEPITTPTAAVVEAITATAQTPTVAPAAAPRRKPAGKAKPVAAAPVAPAAVPAAALPIAIQAVSQTEFAERKPSEAATKSTAKTAGAAAKTKSSKASSAEATLNEKATPAMAANAPKKAASLKPAAGKPAALAAKTPVPKVPAQTQPAKTPAAATAKVAANNKSASKPASATAPKPASKPVVAIAASPVAAPKAAKAVPAPKAPASTSKPVAPAPKAKAEAAPKAAAPASKAAASAAKGAAAVAKGAVATPKAAAPASKAKTAKAVATAATGKKPAVRKAPAKPA